MHADRLPGLKNLYHSVQLLSLWALAWDSARLRSPPSVESEPEAPPQANIATVTMTTDAQNRNLISVLLFASASQEFLGAVSEDVFRLGDDLPEDVGRRFDGPNES